MTLLKEIQNMTTERDVDVPSLLRKCKILNSYLNNAEFGTWIEYELNGYPSLDNISIPKYRNVPCTWVGDFQSLRGLVRNKIIEESKIKSKYKEKIGKSLHSIKIINSISSLVSFSKEESVGLPVDTTVINSFFNPIVVSGGCIGASRVVSQSSFISIIDTVKTKMLDFCLEIEKLYPDIDAPQSKQKAISSNDVTNIFNTFIMGDVGNYSQSSHNVSQNITVSAGDFLSLEKRLLEIGLDKSDIGELEKSIKQDSSKGEQKIGQKVKEWLGDLALKVTNEMTKNGGMALVKKALEQFFN